MNDDSTDGCEVKQGCKDQLMLFACGLSCSPEASSWVNTEALSINVCKKFGDKLYKACKSSELKQADGSCKKVEDEWKSASDFVKGFGATMVDSDKDCFNAAGFAAPMFALVAACAALLRL